MVTLRVEFGTGWPAAGLVSRTGIRCRMVIFSGPMRTSMTRSRRRVYRELVAAGQLPGGYATEDGVGSLIGDDRACDD
jgi:hypothetical protein